MPIGSRLAVEKNRWSRRYFLSGHHYKQWCVCRGFQAYVFYGEDRFLLPVVDKRLGNSLFSLLSVFFSTLSPHTVSPPSYIGMLGPWEAFNSIWTHLIVNWLPWYNLWPTQPPQILCQQVLIFFQWVVRFRQEVTDSQVGVPPSILDFLLSYLGLIFPLGGHPCARRAKQALASLSSSSSLRGVGSTSWVQRPINTTPDQIKMGLTNKLLNHCFIKLTLLFQGQNSSKLNINWHTCTNSAHKSQHSWFMDEATNYVNMAYIANIGITKTSLC